MGAHIRQAGVSDAAEVARLLVAFNSEFDTPVPPVEELERRWSRLLSRGDVTVFLAEAPAEHSPEGVPGSLGFAYLTGARSITGRAQTRV